MWAGGMRDIAGVGGMAEARGMAEVRGMADIIRKVDKYKAHFLCKGILII
jgi:hypothetical protein